MVVWWHQVEDHGRDTGLQVTCAEARQLAAQRTAGRHGLALVPEHDLAESLHRTLRRRSLAHREGGRLVEAVASRAPALGRARSHDGANLLWV
mgnify:CR=1 FL=1